MDDAQWTKAGSVLSCWGANITDTPLCEKTGESILTVRENEKLGKVSAGKIAILTNGGEDKKTVFLPHSPTEAYLYCKNHFNHLTNHKALIAILLRMIISYMCLAKSRIKNILTNMTRLITLSNVQPHIGDQADEGDQTANGDRAD